MASFNPRARVGRDRNLDRDLHAINVSIRAPAWGATTSAIVASMHEILFQSARPRGARLFLDLIGRGRSCVSIRAPAWGATLTSHLNPWQMGGFNPRARVGRDSILARMAAP